MKHLILCREYPPAPSGGIGVYADHVSRLLAQSGEIVHVIGQLWDGAEQAVEERCNGQLIIHRVPVQDWTSLLDPRPSPSIDCTIANGLFNTEYHPQCFSWQAALLAERLVETEGIDVVEAQEYEAPLYYFQLRRALGKGPRRRPPCIVHLHSPTRLIARHNEWPIGKPAVLTAVRLEDYTIAAADALLCPSRYLAGQVEAQHGLPGSAIRVLPYPGSGFPKLERTADTWAHGAVCYVGRLERRKGVIEWVDAAVSVAADDPEVHFEFIGLDLLDADRMGMQDLLARRIPKRLKNRFHFRGPQRRSDLPRFLAKAKIAVVPSRWENFPYTCIEAMESGLPVIASRNGGMAEMIEDGRTGWLANRSGSDGLAEALRRALGAEPKRISEMGHQAAQAIERICGSEGILKGQMDLRRQVVEQGATRSLRLAATAYEVGPEPENRPARRTAQRGSDHGIAVVVTGARTRHSLNRCLENLENQTHPPIRIVVVSGDSTLGAKLKAPSRFGPGVLRFVHDTDRTPGSAKNAGIREVLQTKSNPLAVCFLNAADRLHSRFLAECESVLGSSPNVGLVSCWLDRDSRRQKLWIKPIPGLPYQFLANDAASFSAVRIAALREAGLFRGELNERYQEWDLVNAVLAAGWKAVTIPDVLGYQRIGAATRLTNGGSLDRRMRRKLLDRFPDVIVSKATELIPLHKPAILERPWRDAIKPGRRLAILRMAFHHPRRAAEHLMGKIKAKIRRRILMGMKPSRMPDPLRLEAE